MLLYTYFNNTANLKNTADLKNTKDLALKLISANITYINTLDLKSSLFQKYYPSPQNTADNNINDLNQPLHSLPSYLAREL